MDFNVIVSSCPLRISLFGGSTDNPKFVEKYGRGSVISFPSNLKTYVVLTEDLHGVNKYNNQYVINYSIREQVEKISEIKNDLVREAMSYFKLPPTSVFLTSDISSHGSGLASSSSYLISLIKSFSMYSNLNLSDSEICKLALEIEQIINPYCGYQDPYGCGIGGFKKMEFYAGGEVKHSFLPTDIFREYDFHLVFTGITRNSKEVLKDVTENIENSLPLLDIVDHATESILNKDYNLFFKLLNDSWEIKKTTSQLIVQNDTIAMLDHNLKSNPHVIAHKLCGAGNGGYFLVISKNGSLFSLRDQIKIDLSSTGVEGVEYGIH